MLKISKENKLVFVMGDFIVNLLNYESHNETNDFINTMVSHYLLPHVLYPTRVIDHSATVIDNIFSNNTCHKTVSGSIITQISDHFPQFIILDKIVIDYKSCSYAKRDFSNFDEQKFIAGFSSQSMDFVHDPNVSIGSKFDQFYLSLSSYIDHHAPVKKMNKKDLKLHSKPWITTQIYRLIKYRDKLLRKLNKTFSNSSEYLYKKFRNRAVSELRTSKVNYYKNFFQSINLV